MDAGESKGERETKDHLGKDCREGERQSRVEEMECGQGSGAKQRVLGKERDGLMCLLARREMMMMMMMMNGMLVVHRPFFRNAKIDKENL